jgi:hypothetical protein
LTDSVAGDSTFAGWSGAGCSSTSTCTVTMNANQTVTATFNVAPPPPTLSVNLIVSLSGSTAPANATLSATVAGTAAGTINYTFWWNCSNPTTNVAAATAACGDPDGTAGNANGAKFDGTNDNPKSVSHTYSSAATYTAKVIVERGTASPVQGQQTFTISAGPPPPQTHTECVNYIYSRVCASVSGPGVNRCATNSDCGGGGGNHYACSGTSCVVSSTGPYTESSCDNACGGGGGTRYACSGTSCVVNSTGPYTESSCDNACGGGAFHGECDPAQQACVNKQGAATSTCKIDSECGVPRDTYLKCQSNACVIIGGAGSSSCVTVGQGCVGGWIEIPPR